MYFRMSTLRRSRVSFRQKIERCQRFTLWHNCWHLLSKRCQRDAKEMSKLRQRCQRKSKNFFDILIGQTIFIYENVLEPFHLKCFNMIWYDHIWFGPTFVTDKRLFTIWVLTLLHFEKYNKKTFVPKIKNVGWPY